MRLKIQKCYLFMIGVTAVVGCDDKGATDSGSSSSTSIDPINTMSVFTSDGVENLIEKKGIEVTPEIWAARSLDKMNAIIDISGLQTDDYLFTSVDASDGSSGVVYYIDESDEDIMRGTGSAFRQIRRGIRYKTEAPTIRDDGEYDIVVIYADTHRGSSGNARSTDGNDRADWKDAYTASMSSSWMVTTHELGHILGAHHDSVNTEEPCSGPHDDWACGQIVSADIYESSKDTGPTVCSDIDTLLTTMSYNVDCPCRIEPVFSNPHITINDSEGNTSSLGSSSAYNICIIKNMWGYVSDFSEFDNGESRYNADIPDLCTEVLDSIEYDHDSLKRLYNWDPDDDCTP